MLVARSTTEIILRKLITKASPYNNYILKKADLCSSCARSNRDLVVGIKVRLDRGITDGGRNEHEALLRAMKAARDARWGRLIFLKS